jgi:hypothetical protein
VKGARGCGGEWDVVHEGGNEQCKYIESG